VSPPIDHVIVLALENRSFDHMLGFLHHPDPAFDGLLGGGPHTNPGWNGGPAVAANPDAKHVLPVDPDHSHDAVMVQLGVIGPGVTPTNDGFVQSFEDKGRDLRPPAFEGALAPIANWWMRRNPAPTVVGRGPLIMSCQAPDQVPVLSTLTLGFGVCTRWFASVPGETWPNRNFMHAATSEGTTDIEVGFYCSRTIFELLEAAGRDWHIYYDDTPEVWAFRKLWDDERKANWFRSSTFADHVAAGTLPAYSFIEPNQRPPIHLDPYTPVVGLHDHPDSQHPGNNLIADDEYDAAPVSGPGDFARGEALMAEIYEALRANPEVFERSVLLITYDEHGGTYDHVPPPTDVPAPGGPPGVGALWRLVHWALRRRAKAFDFKMLGVRVPAVVISPWIPAAKVDTTVRDHASIPATVRALFAPDAPPLTARDAWSPRFDEMLTLDQPRTDLPDLSAYVIPPPPADASPGPLTLDEPPLPDHYHDLDELATKVDHQLPGPNQPAELGPRGHAIEVTHAFQVWTELPPGPT
jgi:phospholipase C